MKLTNRNNLPEAVVNAVKNDAYHKGDADISVTGLLKPPRLAVLAERHDDELEEDVSDRIWSLLGQSVHTILERANQNAVAERRLIIEVEGLKVSGGMDLYEDSGKLTDYKLTSVWKLVKGDLDEWTRQLNLYAVLLRRHGHPVNELQIVAFLRDWSKREAERDAYYPQAQVVNVNIPVWAPEEAERYLRERVILHKQAKLSAELPSCTPEDRWAKPAVWAVMKAGRKTALKLFDTEDGARTFAGFDRALTVVHRPGESVRCRSYCPVAKFCNQFQSAEESSSRPSDDAVTKEAV